MEQDIGDCGGAAPGLSATPEPASSLVPSGFDPTIAEELRAAWETFERAMRDDPEYAWGWHCNLAVPIMDAIGVSHEKANVAAAMLMSHLFECDITTHPQFQYGKSHAQAYGEMRLAADREEA